MTQSINTAAAVLSIVLSSAQIELLRNAGLHLATGKELLDQFLSREDSALLCAAEPKDAKAAVWAALYEQKIITTLQPANKSGATKRLSMDSARRSVENSLGDVLAHRLATAVQSLGERIRYHQEIAKAAAAAAAKAEQKAAEPLPESTQTNEPEPRVHTDLEVCLKAKLAAIVESDKADDLKAELLGLIHEIAHEMGATL